LFNDININDFGVAFLCKRIERTKDN